jgi:hypothetical protein
MIPPQHCRVWLARAVAEVNVWLGDGGPVGHRHTGGSGRGSSVRIVAIGLAALGSFGFMLAGGGES